MYVDKSMKPNDLIPDNILPINDWVTIPTSELSFKFSRSGGKGGQNVNKVETRVELIFNVQTSPSLNDRDRELLLVRLASRLDTKGELHIVAQDSRSQWMNRAIAIERLTDVLRAALKREKKRIATKASRGAKEKRLQSKKKRGEIKKMRRRTED